MSFWINCNLTFSDKGMLLSTSLGKGEGVDEESNKKT